LAATDADLPPAKQVETVAPIQLPNRPTGNNPINPRFDAIYDVPRYLMQFALTDAIESYGAMPIDDLIQAAARHCLDKCGLSGLWKVFNTITANPPLTLFESTE
jgi:hypothetical protein